jgi:hypothetical protein
MSYAFYRPEERSSSINYDSRQLQAYSSLGDPDGLEPTSDAPKLINVCGWQTTKCRLALVVLTMLTVIGFLLGHFVIVPMVLKNVVSNAELQFSVIDISNPTNDSFTLTSSGFIDTKTRFV